MCCLDTGVINSFLSWKFFAALSRLTYIGYLIHIITLMTFVFNSSVQIHATEMLMVSCLW